MKITLVAPLVYTTSDIPLLLKKAFELQGHMVDIFPTDESLSPLENALIKNNKNRTSKFYQSFSKRLSKHISATKPEILLIYGSNWAILPDSLETIKLSTDTMIILWEGNFQLFQDFQIKSLYLYDYIFVMDTYLVPLLKGPGKLRNVFYLAQGCDPDIHRPYKLSNQDYLKYGADITYIGWGYPNRIQLFEGLINYNIRLWGLGWEQSHKLINFFSKETVYGVRKSKIYNASKISLNLQGPHIQINGISNRPFEILACGGFCISEEKPDLLLHLKPGEEIITYKDIPDLRNKIEYFIQHEDERKEIATMGRKKVLANRTYNHVVNELLSIICI